MSAAARELAAMAAGGGGSGWGGDFTNGGGRSSSGMGFSTTCSAGGMASGGESESPIMGGIPEKENPVPGYRHDNVVATSSHSNQLHRNLNNRQIQLIAIGGSIGTGLFVSIGGGLAHAGPANLLLGYTVQAVMLALVSNCMAEMCTYMPISSSYIRMAGRWVDEAFGFMAGWNFFFHEAILIPFEISALSLVLGYWWDNVPVWAVCLICIISYGVINALAVKYYGEFEFWMSSGKILLIFLVMGFTFVTMVGGNPDNWAYGFYYWYDPGAFASYWPWLEGTALGNFTGFLAGVYSAGFTVVGPEYMSMVAGEAQRPRIYMKQAFKTIYFRYGFFFIGGALCVGIVVAYTSPALVTHGTMNAAGSPYVIAMTNFGIHVLPDIVNALLVTSIFSAGNAYTYCAMRSLYGLALEGHAPAIFSRTMRNGIPIYAFGVTMIFPFLSFLQAGAASAEVVNWLQNLTQAAQILQYVIMSVTYVCFYRACKVQGLDRKTLPYVGWFQPYSAYIGGSWMLFVVLTFGYSVFVEWSTFQFFLYYTMLMVAVCTFTFWKIFRRTAFVRPEQADLVWEKPLIDAYEEALLDPPTTLGQELLAMFGIKWHKTAHEEDDSPFF